MVAYGIATVHAVFLWRKGFRRDSHVTYALLAAGILFHTRAMLLRGFSLNHCPVTNLFEATLFVMWTIVGTYLVVGLWSRLRFIGAFASPVLFALGVFALMPGLDLRQGGHPELPVAWTSAHAALLALSYGAFGLASVAAAMYLTQERNLKQRKIQAIFSLLPPIQRLEIVIARSLAAGFVLLTLGLAVGALDMTRINNPHAYAGDPKVVWSALVWLLYLALLVMRWRFSQGGRRLALGAIGSFAFVLLTFWGTNILSGIHNPAIGPHLPPAP